MKHCIRVILLLLSFNFAGRACTNFLVTKGASTDGSTMISYTADSFNLYGELYHYAPGIYPEGTMLDVFDWDSGRYMGKIKQARQTYNVIGNMNEYQVVLGETTFGGREELIDSKAILDYGSMMYIALQRSKTAREAIKIMTDLVAEYGYASSGESISISDPNEVWLLEIVGKGAGNKGAAWVAVRIPDGYVSAHANQARITTFPLNDPENCLYAKDVIAFAREKKYFSGKDSEFDFSAAYAPLDFGAIRFCEGRVCSLFRRVNSKMEKYASYIRGDDLDRMPLYIKPDRKISVADMMSLMRDHFEGTEFDMTKGVAAGTYCMPYRWRPLVWEYEGKNYFNERPISTPQTGFSFISQSRSTMPNEVGGLLWFGVDDTYMTVWVPMYACMNRTPKNYKTGIASLCNFNWESAFWVFNFVSNFAYPKYSIIIDDVKKVQYELEGKSLAQQAEIEQKALLLAKSSKSDVVEYLTNYSCEVADLTVARWKKLGEFLLMKYMDGVIKDENCNPINIGYPKEMKRQIVQAEGEHFLMKKVATEIEEEYQNLMIAADKAIADRNYTQAKTSLEKALTLKPQEAAIQEKLSKVTEILKKIDQLNDQYFN